MKIKLASKYGFCQGVKNALNAALFEISHNNDKIYLLNKIVHNKTVNDSLAAKGLIIFDDNRTDIQKIDDINEGTIIFSAHGHDKKLESLALKKGLKIIDATCPLVNLNERKIIESLNKGRTVFYIGIQKHPETNAVLSIDQRIIFIDFKNPSIPHLSPNTPISIHNQTTLIVNDLKAIYDEIKKEYTDVIFNNDICNATSQRQNALNEISDEDLIIIIGDKISSNSNRLYEIAKKNNPDKAVLFVLDLNDLKQYDLTNYNSAFISAGASTPESDINPIIEYLKSI